jgi:hypothetical protein
MPRTPNKIKVFRVEHKIEKYGMYSGSVHIREHDRYHPGPIHDWGFSKQKLFTDHGWLPEDFHYGFADIQQLKEWLSEENCSLLHNAEYHIAVFEASGFVGRTQAIYLYDTRKDLYDMRLDGVYKKELEEIYG